MLKCHQQEEKASLIEQMASWTALTLKLRRHKTFKQIQNIKTIIITVLIWFTTFWLICNETVISLSFDKHTSTRIPTYYHASTPFVVCVVRRIQNANGERFRISPNTIPTSIRKCLKPLLQQWPSKMRRKKPNILGNILPGSEPQVGFQTVQTLRAGEVPKHSFELRNWSFIMTST